MIRASLVVSFGLLVKEGLNAHEGSPGVQLLLHLPIKHVRSAIAEMESW